MAYPHNSGFLLRIFFLNLHTERGQYVDGSNVNDFWRRFFIQGKWDILNPKMTHRSDWLWIGPKKFFKILQNEWG